VDRDAPPAVGGGEQVGGQAVRLGAEQPRGRDGQGTLVEQVVEVGVAVTGGGQDPQAGRAQRGDHGAAVADYVGVEQAAGRRAYALAVVRVDRVAGEH